MLFIIPNPNHQVLIGNIHVAFKSILASMRKHTITSVARGSVYIYFNGIAVKEGKSVYYSASKTI